MPFPYLVNNLKFLDFWDPSKTEDRAVFEKKKKKNPRYSIYRNFPIKIKL